MNLKLFYDFETTGLPLYAEPSGDPRQPHITQVGARLVDASSPTLMVISTIDLIVKPEGWVIPPDVEALNGITTEFATLVGVPELTALQSFLALWRVANERVAFNDSFDCRIGRIAIKRLLQDDALADEWKAAPAYCAMRAAVNHVQVPKANGKGWKQPSLAEAFKHFTGREHVGAHRALVDVDAAMAVWNGIQDAEADAVIDPKFREVGDAVPMA